MKPKLFCETSSGFDLDNIKNTAIVRDFLIFSTWQCQTQSYSTILPRFFKLATSKRRNSARPPSKWKVECRADGLGWALWVNLKFHGGGNFDIFLAWSALQANLKFHAGGNFDIFLSSYAGDHPESTWSSMGVGTLISSYLRTLVSIPSQLEVPRGWEFWYLLALVGTPSQAEVPWGWKFWYYLLTLVSTLKFHGAGNFNIFVPVWALKVHLKFDAVHSSCASRVAQSWHLRNLANVVAQAEFRNPSCAILRVAQSVKCSCAIRVANSDCAILRVAQSVKCSCAIRVAQP